MVILVPMTCHCKPMLRTASQFLLLCISPVPPPLYPPLYSALGSAAWCCPFASRLPVVSGQQQATTKTWRNRGEQLGFSSPALPASELFSTSRATDGDRSHVDGQDAGRCRELGTLLPPQALGIRTLASSCYFLGASVSITQSALQALLLPLEVVSPSRLPC